jgi:hypothetical protein
MLGGYCWGQPWGSPKKPGESCLKPAKNETKHTSNLSTHTQRGPCCGGPRGPPEWPNQAPPSSGPCLARGPLHGRTCSHARVQAFKALTLRHHAPGNHAPTLFRQLPRGSPSPPLWGTVRRGRCQLHDTVLPTPVRLTHRALEGGRSHPRTSFLWLYRVKPWRQAGGSANPIAVSPVRPSPPLQRHAEHCSNHSNTVRHAGTGHRHARHCAPYGSPSTASSSPPGDAPVNHYAFTLETTPVQVQGTPRRWGQSKVRQDDR